MNSEHQIRFIIWPDIDKRKDEVQDTKTGLIWQREHCLERMPWKEAKEYAKSLGLGWRLPTIEELLSLVDYSRAKPSIDTEAFPNTPSGWFWSATPYAGSSSRAWAVYFYGGYTFNFDTTLTFYVRCVRDYKEQKK